MVLLSLTPSAALAHAMKLSQLCELAAAFPFHPGCNARSGALFDTQSTSGAQREHPGAASPTFSNLARRQYLPPPSRRTPAMNGEEDARDHEIVMTTMLRMHGMKGEE